MQTSENLINRIRNLQIKVHNPGYVLLKEDLDEAMQIATHALRLLVSAELNSDQDSAFIQQMLKSMNLSFID